MERTETNHIPDRCWGLHDLRQLSSVWLHTHNASPNINIHNGEREANYDSQLFSLSSLHFDRSVNVFCTPASPWVANWLLSERQRTGVRGEGGREVKETRIRKRGGDGDWKRDKKKWQKWGRVGEMNGGNGLSQTQVAASALWRRGVCVMRPKATETASRTGTCLQ